MQLLHEEIDDYVKDALGKLLKKVISVEH